MFLDTSRITGMKMHSEKITKHTTTMSSNSLRELKLQAGSGCYVGRMVILGRISAIFLMSQSPPNHSRMQTPHRPETFPEMSW